MTNVYLLAPEIALSLAALVLLVAEVWLPRRMDKVAYHLAVIACAGALGMLGLVYSAPALYTGMGTLWVVDAASLFMKLLALVTAVVCLLLTLDYAGPPHSYGGSFSALILLSTVGMMVLVSAVDLLLMFLALELVSITSFILAGFERRDLKSSEGAVKYFLIGAFSSALMVYGISLAYGAAGTTNLTELVRFEGPLALLSLLLILVGLGFKASLVPFHFWVPDAYEGAPTPVTAFLSVAPKITALALLLRVFTVLLPHGGPLDLTLLFSVLAALTMTVGNLTAIFQDNIKRLLAYSSIAQAGYMLIGLVAGNALGQQGLLMYGLAYCFMNLGAFAVAIAVGNEGGYELRAYDGLARRSLGLSLLMAFFLLSLAGIPPLAGFIAKFYVFAAAIEAKQYGLAVVGVLNSVVSVYYYFRIAYRMFFVEPPVHLRDRPVPYGAYLLGGLAFSAAGVFAVGLFPEPFVASVRVAAKFLP